MTPTPNEVHNEVEQSSGTVRLEAFSDGVFAIAITLLVLDVKVPRIEELHDGKLLDALREQWPIYFAFVTSFMTILIMWVNHHRLFKLIKRTDQGLLILNGLLLMAISVVPFPTSLVAEYLRHPDQNVAAAVLAGLYTSIATLYNIVWWYASGNNRLLDKSKDPAWVKTVNQHYILGPILYAVSFVLALFSVPLSLLLNLALTIFLALPGKYDSEF